MRIQDLCIALEGVDALEPRILAERSVAKRKALLEKQRDLLLLCCEIIRDATNPIET